MNNCCHPHKSKPSGLLIAFGMIISLSYLVHFTAIQNPYLSIFSGSVYELVNKMVFGLVLGIGFVGILSKIPREFVISILGKNRGFLGILRATLAGVLLDLCCHGILLVGMGLYRRGASLGQVMAFLIASPWNSFSLTLILWSLIGFKWMLTFLILSFLVAIVSGMIFEHLVSRNILPSNPNHIEIPDNFRFFAALKSQFKWQHIGPRFWATSFYKGLQESKMILKWVLLGIILTASIRTFLPTEMFQTLFGPTLMGLGLTILGATIIEVCSEGSTPIAADILTRAHAPGNSFGFLMIGVSTDYTEVLSLKETTGSWKIALFLPLVTLPQIIIIAYFLNLI